MRSPFDLPFVFLYFATTLIALLVVWRAWKLRRAPGGRMLALFAAAVAEWNLCAGIEALVTTIPAKVLWSQLEYIGTVSIVPTLLAFVLDYLNIPRTRRLTLLTWGISLLTLLFAWSNPLHGWMWSGFRWADQARNILIYEHGWWFWVLVAYIYLATGWALIRLGHAWRKAAPPYQQQMSIMIIGLLSPLAFSIMYLSGLNPIPYLDITPMGMLLTVLGFYIGLTRYRLISLSPVAIEQIFDEIDSGILIFNSRLQLVEINRTARQLLNLEGDILGKQSRTLLAACPDVETAVQSGKPSCFETTLPGDPPRWVDVRLSPLADPREGGYLLTLHDRTQHKAAEETIRQTALDISAALDYDRLFQLILERIVHVIPFDHASITLQDGNTLRVAAGYSRLPSPAPLIGQRFSLSATPYTAILATRQTLRSAETSDPLPGFLPPPQPAQRAVMTVPFFDQEGYNGLLHFDRSAAAPFSAREQHLGEVFAAQLSVALANARLYAEARRTATEQSVLIEILHAITAQLNLDELLTTADQQLRRLIDLPMLLIVLYHPEKAEWERIYLRGADESRVVPTASIRQGITGYIIQHNQPLLLANPEEIDVFLRHHRRQNLGLMPTSFMGAPLHSGGRLLGAVASEHYQPGRSFSQTEFALFCQAAEQISIALHNALLYRQLEQLATHDALTQLYNRRHFLQQAQREFLRARRYKKPLAAVMIDLDHFKQINDTYGHSSGDQVLIQFAEVCRQSLRGSDLLARYGGEEFVLLLPETPLAEAREAAERLHRTIEARLFRIEQGSARITASFGVSVMQPEDASIEALINRADRALYTAKQNGRNRVECV
ncbi:MAG: diguanylate cyclase [Anaerolineae bacterium]|nr:diguanylate cyclase [Anaerolineae bacterium]